MTEDLWEVDSRGVYRNRQCIAKVYRAKDKSLGWCGRVIEKSGFRTLPEIESDVRAAYQDKPEWFDSVYWEPAHP